MKLSDHILRKPLYVAFGQALQGGGITSVDLAATRDATTVTVTASDGSAAPIAGADPATAGVMTAADKTKLDGLTAATMQDFRTRADVAAAVIDPGVTHLRTAGYSAAGDGGGALYKRATVEPTHNLKVQSADLAWWELVPEGGEVNVLQAGAKGDGVADDAPAIQNCIEFLTLHPTRDEYASTPKIVIPPTDAFYLCNAMLTVNRTVIIEGASSGGRSLGAVTLKFADGVAAGIWVQHPGGVSGPATYTPAKLYSGWRAEIHNLALQPVNAGMVDYGIVHNVTATFDHVEVKDFKKAGFFAHGQSSGDHLFGDPNGTSGTGTMFGNTNLSLYQKCMARDTTAGHGFVAQGNNTQVMHYDTCDASGNKGCGFRENSITGNVYTNCHTAQNTIKILHNAVHYMPIKNHISSAADEPGVGANWRDFWIEVTASTNDGLWTVSTPYREAGGYNVVSTAGEPAFLGCYSEGGIEFGIIPRGDTIVIGGVLASFGRVSRHHDGFANTQVYGSQLVNTPALWKGSSADGVQTFGSAIGNADISVPDFFACGHSDDPEFGSAFNLVKFKWSSTGLGGGSYEWIYDGTKEIMAITPTGWDLFNLDPNDATLGSFDTKGFAFFEDGLFYGARPTYLASSYSFAAPVSPLYLPKGAKISFTNNPAGLPHMIHCITGGKVGVLSWDAATGTISNTDTRTGPEVTSGVAVAAFEPLSPVLEPARAGSATIADTASTAAITFATARADANYAVALSADGDERVWVTAKSATGFTVNRLATAGTRVVDWTVTPHKDP
ncbi:MAG: hypothetical protein ACE5EU_01745 [Paracoccaceae bacterium]